MFEERQRVALFVYPDSQGATLEIAIDFAVYKCGEIKKYYFPPHNRRRTLGSIGFSGIGGNTSKNFL